MPALLSGKTSTPRLRLPLSKSVVCCTIVGELNCLRASGSFSLNFLQVFAAPAGANQNINTKTITMSDTYVPLISSGVAGPLGVVHLPRLWQKVSLEAAGKLASGYPAVGKGFDVMTLAALGLDEQAVRDYIKQDKPTYPEFEVWVKQNAKSLTREAIEKHNAAVRGYNHDDATRRGILGACGIADSTSAPRDGVSLNNLDDWYEFHQAVLR
jgi:hypothetical protein